MFVAVFSRQASSSSSYHPSTLAPCHRWLSQFPSSRYAAGSVVDHRDTRFIDVPGGNHRSSTRHTQLERSQLEDKTNRERKRKREIVTYRSKDEIKEERKDGGGVVRSVGCHARPGGVGTHLEKGRRESCLVSYSLISSREPAGGTLVYSCTYRGIKYRELLEFVTIQK